MRISELAEREDSLSVLVATLRTGLSTMCGRLIDVTAGSTEGQPWYEQPLVSAYVVREVADEARRFLVDQIRYTPHRTRAPLQWLAATVAGTRLGFLLGGRAAFSVTPPVPRAEHLVVIPGNQRLRLLDFARRESRVLLKEGFSARSIATEIYVRDSGPGPFPPILDRDPAGRWIVEPLLEGFTLPRCPPWRRRGEYERRAIELLGAYHASHGTSVSTRDYLDEIRAAIGKAGATVESLPGPPGNLEPRVEALAGRALAATDVEVTRGHGDFQAGNVFVEPGPDRVWLIDWETSAVRQRAYDALTYGLAARFPAGLGRRTRAFVAGSPLGPVDELLPEGGDWRAPAAALFLLEDLRWRLEQAAGGRYLKAPAALATLVSEIDVFLGG